MAEELVEISGGRGIAGFRNACVKEEECKALAVANNGNGTLETLSIPQNFGVQPEPKQGPHKVTPDHGQKDDRGGEGGTSNRLRALGDGGRSSQESNSDRDIGGSKQDQAEPASPERDEQ